MSQASQFLVEEKPGHGLDVYKPMLGRPTDWKGFPKALNHSGLHDGWGMIKPITLRELTMVRFMNAVTDKPDWTKKVLDKEIVEKWKAESVNYNDNNYEDEQGVPYELEMTEAMFEYSIHELRYRAEQCNASSYGTVYTLPGDVYKSDTAVSDELKLALQEAVRPLEDVPKSQQDWHPGSDGKVLDLVHPSLFPVIFGKSRILPVGSKAMTLQDCTKRYAECENVPQPDREMPRHFSKKFQWLPCEVDISGEKPKILTYINNLHPKQYTKLYSVIEDIIGAAVPLWELSLALANKGALLDAPRRVQYTRCDYHYEDGYSEQYEDYPEQYEDEDVYTYDARVEQWEKEREEKREVILPEPPSLFDPEPLEGERFTLKEKFGGKPLQVIVKLANIELTPDKPEYGGGTWHVEGMTNEYICATAIYYYSSENVTPSHLAFRQLGHNFDFEDVLNEQDHHDWLDQVYGFKQHGHTIQNVGSVETREGRLLTFPNILQHQVQPFKLADPTKPGHRKILAFFLVDPHFSIISTADVPAQQHFWWAEEIFGPEYSGPAATKKLKELIALLPLELRDKVLADLEDDFPITMQEAKEYREELMEERKRFEISHQGSFESVEISLCEH